MKDLRFKSDKRKETMKVLFNFTILTIQAKKIVLSCLGSA